MSRVPFYLPSDLSKNHPIVDYTYRYINGERTGLDPKFEYWHGTEYFVLRAGGAARAFYQPVKVGRDTCYIYRSMTDVHDHHKVTRMEPLASELESSPENFTRHGGANPQLQAHASVEETSWQGRIIKLTDRQKAAAESVLSSSVTILSGPPGSGKTLSIFKVLQKRVQRLEARGHSGEVVFICETPELVENMTKEWRAWYQASVDSNAKVTVRFARYQEVVASSVKEGGGAKFLGDPGLDCMNFLENYFKRIAKKNISAQKVFYEFLLHADRLLDDHKGKKPFKESSFSKVGARSHIFSDDDLEAVYLSYGAYLKSLEQAQAVNVIFHPQEVEPKQFLDVIADEAHIYSQIQLQMMCLLGQRMTAIMDTHQSGSAVANQDMFQSWLKGLGVNVETVSLPVTLRTPKAVNQLLKVLLDIKRALVGGHITRSAYTDIDVEVIDDDVRDTVDSDGSVSCLEVSGNEMPEHLQAYGRSVDFAVIIADESYRAYAEKLFNTKQVLTLDQARGLEFRQLAAVGWFSLSSMRELSRLLPSLNLRKEVSGNLGSRDAVHEHADLLSQLNNVFTSFSRVKKDLMLVISPKEKESVRHLWRLLVQQPDNAKSNQDDLASEQLPCVQRASSQQEILEKARMHAAGGRVHVARGMLDGYKLGLSLEEKNELLGLSSPNKSSQENSDLLPSAAAAAAAEKSENSTGVVPLDVSNTGGLSGNLDPVKRDPPVINLDTDNMQALKRDFATKKEAILQFGTAELDIIKRKISRWVVKDVQAVVFIIKRFVGCNQNFAREFFRYCFSGKISLNDLLSKLNDDQKLSILSDSVKYLGFDDVKGLGAYLKKFNIDYIDFSCHYLQQFGCMDKGIVTFVSLVFLVADEPSNYVHSFYQKYLYNYGADAASKDGGGADALKDRGSVSRHIKLFSLSSYLLSLYATIFDRVPKLRTSKFAKSAETAVGIIKLYKQIITSYLTQVDVTGLSKKEVLWELYVRAEIRRLQMGSPSRTITIEEISQLQGRLEEKIELASLGCDQIDVFEKISMKLSFANLPSLDLLNYDLHNGGVGTGLQILSALMKEKELSSTSVNGVAFFGGSTAKAASTASSGMVQQRPDGQFNLG